jgi:hypothetical protein
MIGPISFHPDCVLQARDDMPSMNKSWPKHNYPEDIGKPSGGTFAFVVPKLWGDRCEYWADDTAAQFFAMLPVPKGGLAGLKARAELLSGDTQKKLSEQTVPATDGRMSFVVDMRTLPPGKYVARAGLLRADGQFHNQARWPFEKTAKQNPVVRIPAEGIPVRLEAQSFLPDGQWPVTTGVPLPMNAVTEAAQLALFEDGQRVPAQVAPVATWSPQGSIKWVRLSFVGRYKGGKPCEYRLKLLSGAAGAATASLKVDQTADAITVETGALKFQVSRKAFAGIEKAWLDPFGKGQYRGDDPVLARKGAGGPYLIDEKGARFESMRDAEASVVVEEQGAARVVIVATGWYANPDAPEKRLCKFTTRITAAAGSPMLRVSQQTYITYDTRFKQLNDLGFVLPMGGLKSFELGADGAAISGALPAAPATVYLHQDRHDRFRIVGAAEREGKQSDGWFSLRRSDTAPRAVVMLRDVWQKYPKEVEMSVDGAILHFWPAHGRAAFTQEEELVPRNIYKFLCFHQGKLLNLLTPAYYAERFDQYAKDQKMNEGGGWWRESEQAATRSANAQGVVISNDFAVAFLPAAAPAGSLGADAAKLAQLFQFDPTAQPAPEWNAASGALGKMAAADRARFGDFEEAIEQGYLSWNRSVERNADYGMFNYADTHTIWNAEQNRPGLHRVWQACHYHQIGLNWLLWYRSGSPDLLRWARKNTDHFMNVDICNYVDAANPIPFQDHELGAMQHMGWKQHWASSAQKEAWGQFRASVGHFIDPDGMLWCWYTTGDPRAKETYGLWVDAYRRHLASQVWGYAREINNGLAYAITAYQATWDPTLIPMIHTPAYVMRTYMPLENQRPAPLWHPFWMNRYHEQTRDPEYVAFIAKYADLWMGVESTWTLALCAKAYELTGDRKFLDKHLPLVRDWPRGFYREAGSSYDWFGRGEGPLGGNYGYLSWGYFLKVLQEAGSTTLPKADPPRGSYPAAPERFNYFNLPDSVTVVALKEKDQPFTVKLGFEGRACSAVLITPSGKKPWKIDRMDTEKRDDPETIPADGETGLYRLEFRAHRAWVKIPQTDLPVEAALIRGGKPYFGMNTLGWLMPLEAGPVTLKFASEKTGFHSLAHLRIEDAKGAVALDKRLFLEIKQSSAELTLDPAKNPPPWKFDIVGAYEVTADAGRRFLMSSRVEDLDRIARELAKLPPPARK